MPGLRNPTMCLGPGPLLPAAPSHVQPHPPFPPLERTPHRRSTWILTHARRTPGPDNAAHLPCETSQTLASS